MKLYSASCRIFPDDDPETDRIVDSIDGLESVVYRARNPAVGLRFAGRQGEVNSGGML